MHPAEEPREEPAADRSDPAASERPGEDEPSTSPPDETHEATSPPDNPEGDEGAVERGADELDQAGGGH